MKKLVSSTLALAMLATPVGAMASSACEVSQENDTKSSYEFTKHVEPKKSHKLRNTLIVGATVAGVAVISVATHKVASKVCATESNPENKVVSTICDKNSKISEKSTELAARVKTGAGTAAKFVSDHTKAIYENCKNLFARSDKESKDTEDTEETIDEAQSEVVDEKVSEEENFADKQ